MSKGIDVSAHQGNINWDAVKASGIDFAIIRISYGQNSVDSKAIRNIEECIRVGMPFGVYTYSYALNINNAINEANLVIKTLAPYKDKVKFPVIIDMEDADGYKLRNNINYSTCIDICEIFCKYIESFGYYAGIYANLDWLNNKINNNKLDRFDKWVAQWSNTCDYKKEYALWQYSSKGVISGIQGNVDLNYALKDYPTRINNNNFGLKYLYTVQAGDTLSKIAHKFNTNWRKIYELNKETIGSNPNYIKVGQNLIIKGD